jgi:hypothetical protein
MTQNKNITTKLVKILESLASVPKKGYNKHQNYYYMREVDVLEALKEELVKNKVLLLTSSDFVDLQKTDVKDRVTYLTTVKTKHTFIDSETGEELTITSVGSGYDNTDKGAAKAITSAVKYALMKTFMISDEGSDIENDGESIAKPAPTPKKFLGNTAPTVLPTQTETTPPVKSEVKVENKVEGPIKRSFGQRKFITNTNKTEPNF